MSLERLRDEGLRWVEANKSKRFAGVTKLLTDLYPDDAHFIYELLQNAEDARDRSVSESSGASLVRFTLRDDALEFEHNGEGLFTLEDVEQITGIGHSMKRDDPTSIGKFGIGFKAVFAYTNTPEIHSGEFHFRIHDLVVPEEIDPKKPRADQLATRFIFPFDNPKKPAGKAAAEIERGLRDLDDSTLLFLSHIHTIEYSLPDGSVGSVQRIDHEGGHIEVRTNDPGGHEHASHWLRFQRDVEVEDEDGEATTCRIGLAFRLALEDGKEDAPPKWRIVPVDHGQVSIYFPAEKETSNLRFHLHAPFASTVARDSVRNCPANRALRDHLASLIADSLAPIRDQGMLTMDFLAVLPNRADNLPPFYEPIRLAIVKAFQEQLLVPMKYGGHAAAKGIFRGPGVISDVLEDDGLILLLGADDYVPPMWAANPPQRNQREDRFLDSLGIDVWEWKELARSLRHLDADGRRRLERWISQKNDVWLMRFYALMNEAWQEHRGWSYVYDLHIVRVASSQGDEHVLPSEAFFPSDEGADPVPGVRFVKPSVYSTGRSDRLKEGAHSFLTTIGVRPFDDRADIEVRLADYERSSRHSTSVCRQELMQFVRYWKEHPNEAGLFDNRAFLLGAGSGDKLCFYKPTQLYLDSPFLETGLAELAAIHGKHPIWDGYREGLSESQLGDVTAFLRTIGVMHELKVETTRVWSVDNPSWRELMQDWLQGRVRRTETQINQDYTISDLDKYIGTQTIWASRLIWNALVHAGPECAQARYRPNQQYPTRVAESFLVYQLKRHAWIPDKSGVFRKPEDMTKDDLRTDFPYDDRNGLLTAIGFGERARKRQADYSLRNRQAQSIGFASLDEAHKMAQVAELLREQGRSPDELISQIKAPVMKKAPAFPRRSVASSERREERLSAALASAAEKQYEQRERSVRTTRATIEPKVSLRGWYTNEEEQMICQICHQEMPFRGRDGEYYFEAVEALSSSYFPTEYEAQFLALCPLCAAMYKEFVKQDEDAMEALRNALVDSEEPQVPLQLGELSTRLRFVESHFQDIKTILEMVSER